MFPWIKYLQNVFVFLFSLLLFHLHEQILLSSVTFTIFPCFSAVAISDSHISRGRSLINSFLSKFIWYLLTTQQAWTVPYWCSYPKDQTLRTNLTFNNSNTMLKKTSTKTWSWLKLKKLKMWTLSAGKKMLNVASKNTY